MPNPQVLDQLAKWNKKKFRSTGISFTRAVDSLATEKPLIEVRPTRGLTRWTVIKKGTDTPAILFHAALWRWGSNMETGNFVPPDQDAAGIAETRLQTAPSFKCEITYAFDASEDPSLYNLQKGLENHVVKNPDFNRGKKPRRTWQNGMFPADSEWFIMTSPIFLQKSLYNRGQPVKIPYELHPWIQSTLSQSENSKFIANPERPNLLVYEDGVLKDLKDSNPSIFESDDIICFSFTVAFIVGSAMWGPEYRLVDLIRVGKMPTKSVSTATSTSTSNMSVKRLKAAPLQLGSEILPSEDGNTDSESDSVKASGSETQAAKDPNITSIVESSTSTESKSTVVKKKQDYVSDNGSPKVSGPENKVEKDSSIPDPVESSTDVDVVLPSRKTTPDSGSLKTSNNETQAEKDSRTTGVGESSVTLGKKRNSDDLEDCPSNQPATKKRAIRIKGR